MEIDEDEPLAGEARDKDDENEARGPLIGMAVTLATILVLAGISYGYFSGALDPWLESLAGPVEVAPASVASGDEVVYELPEILIALGLDGDKPNYLKLRVSLEFPNKEGVRRVERVLPRLMDEFNLFLSQLRPEDLRGASGLHRVREELADRASALVQPSQVSAILFREIMIQ
jgi:flagellar protein FliL